MLRSSGSAVSLASARDDPALEHRFDFGAEDETVAGECPVERLDAQPVARQQQTAALGIPDGEREHAAEAFDAGVAPFLVGMDDRFGVAARPVAMTVRFEHRPDLRVVVDLAVEDDLHGAVLVAQRLVAGREIDDAQAAMRQARESVDEHVPASSGPRCVMMSRIATRRSRSCGRSRSEATMPAMPHMLDGLRVARARGGGAVDELAEPELQHHQLPETVAMIGAAVAVLRPQPRDLAVVEARRDRAAGRR